MSKGESKVKKDKKDKKINKKILKKKRIVRKGLKVDSVGSGMGGILPQSGPVGARSLMLARAMMGGGIPGVVNSGGSSGMDLWRGKIEDMDKSIGNLNAKERDMKAAFDKKVKEKEERQKEIAKTEANLKIAQVEHNKKVKHQAKMDKMESEIERTHTHTALSLYGLRP